LHRYVYERVIGRPLNKNEAIDHIDGLGINCVRSNLRLATQSQNRANSRMNKLNTSGFRGVSFHKRTGKWNAKIRIKGKLKDLGLYDTAEAAYEVYKQAAREEWGEFANLN